MNAKIVGGDDTRPERYPYMVSIQFLDQPYEITNYAFFDTDYFFQNENFSNTVVDEYFDGNDFHFCGGSLISSRAVLTSADCADRVNLFDSQVVIGCDDISEQVTCTVAAVQEAIIHPNFLLNRTSFGDDIGIIILDESVNNPTIPLASPNITIQNGEQVRHIGYGATFNLNTPSRAQLQEINLDLVENEVCVNQLEDVFNVGYQVLEFYDYFYYDYFYDEYQPPIESELEIENLDTIFCAVGNGESGCKTDFGGPVLYPCDTDGVDDIQLGVFSFTFNCGGDGIPIVVGSVFSETAFDFIQTVIQNFTLDDVQFVERTDEFCPEFPIDPVIPPTPFPTLVVGSWTCNPFFYARKDGCDCNCGIPDPDCGIPGQKVLNCIGSDICLEGLCVAQPTLSPTFNPTINPTTSPSFNPTINPTISPTFGPSTSPTTNPTINPTLSPTENPTGNPTANPSLNPTVNPTLNPTKSPTLNPTVKPTPSPIPFFQSLDSRDVVLASVLLILAFVSLILILFQKKQKKKQAARLLENKEEELNLQEINQSALDFNFHKPGGFKTLMDDDTFSLSSGISELQKRRSMGVESAFTLQTTNTALTDNDKANHMKVRSVISRHTKYSQISDIMLELNNLATLKGEAKKKSFIEGVASFLTENLSEEVEQVSSQLAEFDSEEEPEIALSFYILRLVEGVNFWYEPSDVFNATIGMRSLLLSLHFLRKMQAQLDFKTTSLNIHKTMAILVLLSAKFIEDKPFSNAYWGAVAGVGAGVISTLEDIFCFSIGFDFTIDEGDLRESLNPFESINL